MDCTDLFKFSPLYGLILVSMKKCVWSELTDYDEEKDDNHQCYNHFHLGIEEKNWATNWNVTLPFIIMSLLAALALTVGTPFTSNTILLYVLQVLKNFWLNYTEQDWKSLTRSLSHDHIKDQANFQMCCETLMFRKMPRRGFVDVTHHRVISTTLTTKAFQIWYTIRMEAHLHVFPPHPSVEMLGSTAERRCIVR